MCIQVSSPCTYYAVYMRIGPTRENSVRAQLLNTARRVIPQSEKSSHKGWTTAKGLAETRKTALFASMHVRKIDRNLHDRL